MSSADRRRIGSPGYTFVEITAVLAMVTLIATVIERSLASTQDAERMLSATRVCTERGQKAAFDLRDMVGASRKLYGDDAVGRAYLAALDRTRFPPVSTARLPVFDEVNPLGPDTAGDPRTGNVLLFVREADGASAVAVPATKKRRLIDTYRFVCAYQSVPGRTLIPGNGLAIDLVVWKSVVYPSYAQIMAITDATEKSNVVKDLYNRFGFDTAWDANAVVGAAFYDLKADGTVVATPKAQPKIEEDPVTSTGGRLVYADVQLARSRLDSQVRKPVFSVQNPSVWAPNGFEVKVAGASGSRKVWLRLVAETPAGRNVAVNPNTVIASTKDL